ncbi:ABC transporter permease [Microbacterium sp. EST19A]|uniref:ABC transporter permease n=1 Tax=Microbacterium sp. EST19A TaxID=2862681 RepID=UPI001CBD0E18|nr:ABC transporter permease [Microbacterium sp. EST19A]
MNEILAQILTVGTLAVILAKTAPILLAALGGGLTQVGNILNIGLEGLMLVGAFAGIAVGAVTTPFIGVIAALGAGVLLALIYAIASLVFKADYIVVGIGINLLAIGVTVLLLTVFYGNAGVTPGDVKSVLPKIGLGPVGDIPVIGPLFDNHTILVWVALLLVPVYWFVLYRTRYGVHLRAVGEDEPAAVAAGIRVFKVKFISIIVSGALCGLAGAQLAMASVGSFTAGMTSGRGFIVVAAVIFAAGKPVPTLIVCLIFGAADGLADRLALGGVNSSLALLTPYVITIIALVVAALRVRAAVRARTRRGLAQVTA